MSIPSFPRDGDDERHEPRGRAVPRLVEPEPVTISIVVNGVSFGTVDPHALKVRAQMDLERVRGVYDLLDWCRDHAGVGTEALRQLEDELAEMPLGAAVKLATEVSEALARAIQIPKASGRR